MNPDLYEKHYEFEWNHRAYLSSAQNIPIAVMSIVGGVLAVLIQKFPYSSGWETKLFIFLVSLAVLFLILSIIHLFKAIIGYQYERIATPLKLEQHYNELLEWWLEHGGGGEKEAREDHEKFILKRIAEATETNAKNNKTKSLFLYKTNVLLAVTFVSLSLASVPYLIKTVNKSDKTYKVELIKTPQEIITERKMTEKGQDTTQQKPQNDPPPPKPEGPPNEYIKEDVARPTARDDKKK
ncbi:MAG: hypothetical protein D3909_07820 [Candidatus Electrothrix sp. ATG1]|nr:hypothetical protein [Candidatus Electrothrix sp. ATG1]